jgi:hypothetical protein
MKETTKETASVTRSPDSTERKKGADQQGTGTTQPFARSDQAVAGEIDATDLLLLPEP